VERKRVEQVRLIGTNYIEPLASHEPIAEEVRIFEQENRSRELEQELKATLNFFRRTITSTIIVEP
jgi:hypothetical protein